jgi:iron(III) transport system ATP-binding protein
MSNNAVSCLELNKAFAGVPVVRDLSLRVEQGHILALLGPSGCGKTTTLRLIAGFEQVDSGRIEIAGQLVADPGEGRGFHLPPEKRRVGMVFQDYAIFPHLDVAANVAFGLGRGRNAQARTETMLELVGLAGLGPQMPYELSGGQQQRVALARALAPEPAVLLLDEPFSNLDTSLRVQVRREVRQMLKQTGATAVFVTHDQEEALFIGDEVAVMNEGRLEQIGTPYDIFHRPQSRFVAEFMGQTDFVAGRGTADGVETPLGLIAGRVQGVAPDTAVEVALRPDDVALTEATDGGNGRIVERRFVGIAHIYLVALADGSLVHSWQPHTVAIAAGAAVHVSLRPGHPVTCFAGERRLEIGD